MSPKKKSKKQTGRKNVEKSEQKPEVTPKVTPKVSAEREGEKERSRDEKLGALAESMARVEKTEKMKQLFEPESVEDEDQEGEQEPEALEPEGAEEATTLVRASNHDETINALIDSMSKGKDRLAEELELDGSELIEIKTTEAENIGPGSHGLASESGGESTALVGESSGEENINSFLDSISEKEDAVQDESGSIDMEHSEEESVERDAPDLKAGEETIAPAFSAKGNIADFLDAIAQEEAGESESSEVEALEVKNMENEDPKPEIGEDTVDSASEYAGEEGVSGSEDGADESGELSEEHGREVSEAELVNAEIAGSGDTEGDDPGPEVEVVEDEAGLASDSSDKENISDFLDSTAGKDESSEPLAGSDLEASDPDSIEVEASVSEEVSKESDEQLFMKESMKKHGLDGESRKLTSDEKKKAEQVDVALQAAEDLYTGTRKVTREAIDFAGAVGEGSTKLVSSAACGVFNVVGWSFLGVVRIAGAGYRGVGAVVSSLTGGQAEKGKGVKKAEETIHGEPEN